MISIVRVFEIIPLQKMIIENHLYKLFEIVILFCNV